MTFIQPNKNKSIWNDILALLVAGLVAGVFGMVVLYNATVNLDHNVATAKTELDQIGAANTKLKNQIVAALGASDLGAVAAANGLVEDAKPQYFQVRGTETWSIASHF